MCNWASTRGHLQCIQETSTLFLTYVLGPRVSHLSTTVILTTFSRKCITAHRMIMILSHGRFMLHEQHSVSSLCSNTEWPLVLWPITVQFRCPLENSSINLEESGDAHNNASEDHTQEDSQLTENNSTMLPEGETIATDPVSAGTSLRGHAHTMSCHMADSVSQ